MNPSAYLDPSGCITDPALSVLSCAPPGAAPTEITSHLSRCARCQERYLAFEAARERPARHRRRSRLDGTRVRRLGVLFLAVLVFFVATLLYLVGQLT